jgi:Cu/Zn superoxide dismutase
MVAFVVAVVVAVGGEGGGKFRSVGWTRKTGCSTLPTTVQNSMHTIRAITITTATTIAITITTTITNSTTPGTHTSHIHKILQGKLLNDCHRNCKRKNNPKLYRIKLIHPQL